MISPDASLAWESKENACLGQLRPAKGSRGGTENWSRVGRFWWRPNDANADFNGMKRITTDRSVSAERSFHRTSKAFDVVDGEELCAGVLSSTRKVVRRALSVPSASPRGSVPSASPRETT